MKYIIANWKANKTVYQAVDWMQQFIKLLNESKLPEALKANQLKIVICPAFPFIPYIKQNTLNFSNLHVGAQNVSHLEEGKHTGEVTASMMNGLVEFSIVGHSERRSELNESEELIALKLSQLKKNNIQSILCIRNEKDTIYDDASYITYEPVDAIGSGNNMSIDQVLQMKQKLSLKPSQLFIYGGSVSPQNCKEYVQNNQVDGVLVGTDALNPHTFFRIAESAVI